MATTERGAFRPSCPPRKRQVARVVSRTPLPAAARRWERARPLSRIFNFHSVPEAYVDSFEQILDHLAARFEPAWPEELEDLLRAGPETHSRALFTFDDGLANHELAAAALERRGIRAIFCIPASFPSLPLDQQAAWFSRNVYPVPTELHESAERRALTWEQVAALAHRGHRICSHGVEHVPLTASTPANVVHREVVESRRLLEERLPGVAVDGFCWPGAADPSARPADELIRATYGYSLGNNVRPLRAGASPYSLPRVNLEASWPLDVVDLQLSGVLDALYAIRRWRA